MNSEVEYRMIAGLSGYRFGEDGSVWSRWKFRGNKKATLGEEWHRMKPGKQKSGHLFVILKLDNETHRTYRVHRLIATAFLGGPPPGYEVRHLDGDPTNNNVANLAWGTRSENIRDRYAHGGGDRGSRSVHAKINEDDVRGIRKLRRAGMRHKEIASLFGLSWQHTEQIASGRRWSHVE